MKIAVVAAGRQGTEVVKEAQNRGFAVTAFRDDENKSGADNLHQKRYFGTYQRRPCGF